MHVMYVTSAWLAGCLSVCLSVCQHRYISADTHTDTQFPPPIFRKLGGGRDVKDILFLFGISGRGGGDRIRK